ncbi:MAG: hypothetical protein AB1Z19_09535 [Eubacteriales bacterium]
MHAVRNVRLCTKDCLCLYVCPTGATDTETGQIDAEKCISGCRVCVDACPSHAISLVPEHFPEQQEKTAQSIAALRTLAQSKIAQSKMAQKLGASAEKPGLKALAKAIGISNHLMAEDLLREAGYMLPQSENVQRLLESLLAGKTPEGFPKEEAERLIILLKQNNK